MAKLSLYKSKLKERVTRYKTITKMALNNPNTVWDETGKSALVPTKDHLMLVYFGKPVDRF